MALQRHRCKDSGRRIGIVGVTLRLASVFTLHLAQFDCSGVRALRPILRDEPMRFSRVSPIRLNGCRRLFFAGKISDFDAAYVRAMPLRGVVRQSAICSNPLS